MSFALLENFRKNPLLVAGGTPIVSFDHEQHQGGDILKNKPGDQTSFSVKGDFRIAAVDLAQQNNMLMIRATTEDVESKIVNEDWMPIFYLPWIADATARTTLRRRSQTTRTGLNKGLHQMAANNKFLIDQNNLLSGPLDPNDPDVFITSSVNGCSVTIRGSREEPTVYHGNAKSVANLGGKKSPVEVALQDEIGAASLMDLKRQTMEGYLTNFEIADAKADRLGGMHTATQSKMLVQSNYQMLVFQGKAPPSQINAVKQISKGIAIDEGRKVKNVKVTSSQGTVFGIRNAAQWTFYYQKLVKYELWVDQAPWFAKANWQKVPGSTSFRLVEFGEFWPGGPGLLV